LHTRGLGKSGNGPALSGKSDVGPPKPKNIYN